MSVDGYGVGGRHKRPLRYGREDSAVLRGRSAMADRPEWILVDEPTPTDALVGPDVNAYVTASMDPTYVPAPLPVTNPRSFGPRDSYVAAASSVGRNTGGACAQSPFVWDRVDDGEGA